MLEHLLREGEAHVGLLVLWIVGYALLCIRNRQPVALELDVRECSIGKVYCKLGLRNPRALRVRCLDRLGVVLDCLFEAVVLELPVALVL